MTQPNSVPDIEAYGLMRSALALFDKPPAELDANQLAQASAQALKEYEIENRVLKSPEAASVIVTEQALANAMKQIRERFDDDQSFDLALANNGLGRQSLQSALLRQCKVENVLESVASRASNVSEVEVGLYYHMHPEKFQRPEQRSVRHILITINDDYPENSRENALQRISELADKLKRKPHKFADLAMKHSECPTALQGGELGAFARGTLYPEIDAALFSMKEGQISNIIETEAGFHLIQCGKIHPAESMSLKKAQPKIRKLMQERMRRTCQRAWLASLPAQPHSQSAN